MKLFTNWALVKAGNPGPLKGRYLVPGSRGPGLGAWVLVSPPPSFFVISFNPTLKAVESKAVYQLKYIGLEFMLQRVLRTVNWCAPKACNHVHCPDVPVLYYRYHTQKQSRLTPAPLALLVSLQQNVEKQNPLM